MRLQEIPPLYIKQKVHHYNGFIVVFDEFYLPYGVIISARTGVAFFDENGLMKWMVNLLDDVFWQKSGDCFTGFVLYGEDPVLISFSCHAYDVNMINGNLTCRGMTK